MHKDSIPWGSDVSAGKFRCNRHPDVVISMPSRKSLPPCNSCNKEGVVGTWRRISGQGDAPQDPYPNKKK